MLRDYQTEICAQVNEAFDKQRSVMVQMPTGTGKTVVLAELVIKELKDERVKEGYAKILIVAHRRELIEQIKATITRMGLNANNHSSFINNQNIIVESIQTISRRIDSLDFTPSLVVIDEAHHALAKTYKMMWDTWPDAKFLGLTATPCRLNGKGFTDLFDILVKSWDIPAFIKAKWLSTYDFVSIKADSHTQQLIGSLKKRGADGDYQVKEMDAVLNKRPSIERLYNCVMEYAHNRKGFVYAINIDHARSIADYYQSQGVSAVAIDSHTPVKERDV
ncbi:MAG: DEAD/DEAH box helicase, partial [Prevotella sp.]